MKFDHDQLIAHINDVNPRTERHGDEEKLACDVSVDINKAENETPASPGELSTWQQILAELFGSEHTGAYIDLLAMRTKTLAFIDELSIAESKVNFYAGSKKLAELNFARLNKFVWHQKDGVEWVTVRMQALADGPTIGKLAQLIGGKVRVETVVIQSELDLGGGEEAPEEAPAAA